MNTHLPIARIVSNPYTINGRFTVIAYDENGRYLCKCGLKETKDNYNNKVYKILTPKNCDHIRIMSK